MESSDCPYEDTLIACFLQVKQELRVSHILLAQSQLTETHYRIVSHYV